MFAYKGRARTRILRVVSLAVIAAWLLTGCGASGEQAATPTTISAPSGAATATTAQQSNSAGGQATATQAQSQQTGSAPALKNADTIVFATSADAVSLDPAWLYDTASANVVANVYETLIFPKQEKPDEYVPLLASKWDVSPDGKTYTFTIRKGIKFQQGQDLTPEDVAYTFWRGLIQDRSGGPQWILLQPFFGLNVSSFEADVVGKQHNNDWVAACQAAKQAVTFDNTAGTVTMQLKQPYGPMLQILSAPVGWASIISKSWASAQGDWDGNCATAQKFHDPKAEDDKLTKVMNGTGPFKFDRWAPGEEIDLSRNDNYWLKDALWEGRPTGPAKASRVVIKIVPEWGTRFAMFKTGDADVVEVPRNNVAQVDPLVKETCVYGSPCTVTNANGFLRLYKGLPSPQADGLFFNQNVNLSGGNPKAGSGKLDGKGVPPDFFADIHVRKAFNYCFDWDTYINQVFSGEAQQALGPFISGSIGFDPKQAHYSLDLAKCASEFKAAAIKSADGQSLWDTGFLVQYTYATGTEEAHTEGQILKQNLAKVNPKFKLDIIDEDWPAINKDLVDGRMAIFQIGWIQDFNDPQDWAVPYLGSGGAFSVGQGFSKESQAKYDDLILKAAQSTDQAERAKLYQQLQNMAYEDAIDIFGVQPQVRRYEQTWIKGWYFNPSVQVPYFYALSKGQ